MADLYDKDAPENWGLDDELEGAGRRWLPRLMTVAVAVVAIGGFAGILVYAYNKGKEVGSTTIPPTIKAGPAPHKIRPANPGGMAIPNRGMDVYSRLAASSPPRNSTRKVERLLPVPESLVASPAPVKKPAAAPKKIDIPPEPRVVKVVPKPPQKSKPRRVANAAATTGHATDALPQTSQPATARKWPSVKTLATIAPATGGSTRVQLAALRSEKAVRKAWAGFRKRHADLLGSLNLTVRRRNLGSKKGVYYRLQTGPLANVAAAKALCSQFKKRKIGCIVVRR